MNLNKHKFWICVADTEQFDADSDSSFLLMRIRQNYPPDPQHCLNIVNKREGYTDIIYTVYTVVQGELRIYKIYVNKLSKILLPMGH